MENVNTQSSEGQSSSTPSFRGKTDPAWAHFSQSRGANGRCAMTCLYCSKTFSGGGINRMKYHLAGIPGQIAACKKVPYDVRNEMKNFLKEGEKKKNEAKESITSFNEAYGTPDTLSVDEDYEEVPELKPLPSKKIAIEKERGAKKISDHFVSRTTTGSQPSIRSALAGKDAKLRVDIAIARWFYDACIPFYALHSPYYQPAIDAIAAIGSGYRGPSYHDVRVNLLNICKKECSLLVDQYKSNWANSGCTIMADGWTDKRQRTLINFLVYCPTGISFIQSIDASDTIKDAQTLFKLFANIVEYVGPQNVVHMVTDNAANYVAAGALLHKEYEWIYWSPCAAHCMNLILKDIGKLPYVDCVVNRASKVTIYVYNHIACLSWLRKRPGWKEIVRPAVTRFATNFITLKALYDRKHDLQALVTSQFFTCSKDSKTVKAKVFGSIVLDPKFWEQVLLIVKVGAPIIRMLRVVDSDEKPSLGYVYEGLHRAKNGVMNIFMNKSKLYKPYVDIIDKRWDKHFRHDIYAAAYFLNPAFIYDSDFNDSVEIMNGLLDMIEKKSICPNGDKALREIRLYRECLESFGRASAISTCKTMQPDEWWRLFGYSAPNLQKLAIRILSQTASSSGCERNWSVFDRIHTKKRNRLEHKRLDDLVYVTYNLRLKQRLHFKKRTYDPVDYECIDKTDFWVQEEEPENELTYEDLEEIEAEMSQDIYQEGAIPVNNEPTKGSRNEDVADEDEFDIRERIDDIHALANVTEIGTSNIGCGIGPSMGLRDEVDDEVDDD